MAHIPSMPDWMNRSIRPMLAMLARAPFDSPEWSFELKWDGVRVIAFVQGSQVRLQSRNLKDVSNQYVEMAALGPLVRAREAILDGEVVALREGKPSFELLQTRMQVAHPSARLLQSAPVEGVFFDLLYLDGEPLVSLPLVERQARLFSVLSESPAIHHTQVVDTYGVAFFAAVRRMGLEGIVGKHKSSPYQVGRRSPTWQKIKAVSTQYCVVGGYTLGTGAIAGLLGALRLGVYEGSSLRYAGKVGTGFTDHQRREILELLRPLRTSRSPFVPDPRIRDLIFVEPQYVVEVTYLEWTREGKLRHASFRGFRPDLAPSDCVREDIAQAVAPGSTAVA